MDQISVDSLQIFLESTAKQYMWMFVAAAIALFFKSAIENFVSGLTFYYGNDYNVDDIVYINGTKKARIVRQTWTKTVFYLQDIDPERRLVVANSFLSSLAIEKVLPIEPTKIEKSSK